METRLFGVPTFYGHVPEELRPGVGDLEEPTVPIFAYREDGLRIILGSSDGADDSKPDIKIERRPQGWAIFIHPNAGDPCCFVYVLDDGRSFLKYDRPLLEILDDDAEVPTLDELKEPKTRIR